MELRLLTYFLAVAREESITAAAQVLHVTQPTLSKQLKELELELGKQLFIRGNRKITLTEDGLFFYKRAQEIIELVNKTEHEMKDTQDVISGDIFIGGAETDCFRIVARVIKKLQHDYPLIHFHVFSGNATDVTEKLDRGLLDFGLLIEPADIKKYEFIRLPGNDTWGVVMRKDSPLATKESIHPEDIAGLPLLCSAQTLVRNEIAGWAGISFDKLNIVTSYNLIYNASIMVDEGVGYALGIDRLINTSGNSNLVFKPLEPQLNVGLDIVWKKYQVFSKAGKLFLSYLQKEIN